MKILTVEASLKNKTNKKHIKKQKLNMQIAKYPVIFLFHRHLPQFGFVFLSKLSESNRKITTTKKNGNFFPLLLKRVTPHSCCEGGKNMEGNKKINNI